MQTRDRTSKEKTKKKLTFKTLRCIFILTLYFPFASNSMKQNYIQNNIDDVDRGISTTLIAKGMKILGFHSISSNPYLFQRNTVGAIAARGLWSEFLLSIIATDDTFFGFVDETAIDTGATPKKSYAFC